VILHQLAQRFAQLRARGGDRGEQFTVLALVVPGKRGAESVASEKQVASYRSAVN
jgi:hypothetical protein